MKLRLIAATAAFASIIAVASAGDIYSTGFENFTPGAISGQQGWSSNAGNIEGTVVESGSQALEIDAASAGFDYANKGLSYSTGNSTVTYQVDYENSGGPNHKQAGIAIFGNTQFLAQMYTFGTGGFELGNYDQATGLVGDYATGTWHHLDIELDFQTETMSGFVDNNLIGTLSIDTPTPTTAITGIQLYSHAPGGQNYFDNVSVSATPEPFTMTLGIGCVGLAVRRKLRKA